ncbi:hypothetical protein TRVL_04441 [Trypanosoma vivax]|nr:hypothetical protein TRVL_04441 [Trypanosoma vivax]
MVPCRGWDHPRRWRLLGTPRPRCRFETPAAAKHSRQAVRKRRAFGAAGESGNRQRRVATRGAVAQQKRRREVGSRNGQQTEQRMGETSSVVGETDRQAGMTHRPDASFPPQLVSSESGEAAR